MLRIGCVKYLNARPLIHGWEGDIDFDHPSVLCTKLATGKLDVALVSSFEFLRNPIYRIVDDVSISSDGPVYSVIVAHRGEIGEIKEIELDPASETSANLLRCLITEHGLNPRLVQRSIAAPELETRGRAHLFIGDQAVRFRQEHTNEFHFWDLGEQWKKLIGLPFVYALWLIRPEVANPKEISSRLRALRDENLAYLDRVIEDAVAGGGLSRRSHQAKANDPAHSKIVDREFFSRYYRYHLRFSFGEKEKQGLQIFANLCERHSLLPKCDLAFRVV
jgi:chorismate dehydratase